jgi:rare lipoprotein A
MGGIPAMAQLKAKSPSMGIASYYAQKFHGRKTASGEVFDNTAMTAAHNTLPLGTFIKVTNIRNNRWVIVKVTD